MIQKQTVYLPVKIEDDSTFLITKEISNYLQCNSSIDFHKNGKCTYTPVFITETSKESEELEHLIIERLDKKEGYFFTPEQLNEYTANVIKQALETASENAKTYRDKEFYMLSNVSKKSITNTFEETFKKFEV